MSRERIEGSQRKGSNPDQSNHGDTELTEQTPFSPCPLCLCGSLHSDQCLAKDSKGAKEKARTRTKLTTETQSSQSRPRFSVSSVSLWFTPCRSMSREGFEGSEGKARSRTKLATETQSSQSRPRILRVLCVSVVHSMPINVSRRIRRERRKGSEPDEISHGDTKLTEQTSYSPCPLSLCGSLHSEQCLAKESKGAKEKARSRTKLTTETQSSQRRPRFLRVLCVSVVHSIPINVSRRIRRERRKRLEPGRN